MSRHHYLLVCLCLLPVTTGCSPTLGGFRLFSSSAKKAEQDDIVHTPATYISFGDFRVASAVAKETTPELKQQYLEDARRSYLKALEVDEKYIPAYEAMAKLMLVKNDDVAAVAVLRKGLLLAPNNDRLWNELAMCQCRAKNFNEAIVSLQRALEASPGNRAYTTALGLTQARAGLVEESLATLTRVQGEAQAHYNLARMMRHMNQADLARKHAQLAMASDPTLPGPRDFIAILDGKAAPDVQRVGYTEAPASPEASIGPPQRATPIGTVVPEMNNALPGSPQVRQTSSAPAPMPAIISVPMPPQDLKPAASTVPQAKGEQAGTPTVVNKPIVVPPPPMMTSRTRTVR